jgi:hypothetical protein
VFQRKKLGTFVQISSIIIEKNRGSITHIICNVKVLWVSGTHINPMGKFNVNAGNLDMVPKSDKNPY